MQNTHNKGNFKKDIYMFLKKFNKSCKVVLILSAISSEKLSYYIIALLAYSNMSTKERDEANVIIEY